MITRPQQQTGGILRPQTGLDLVEHARQSEHIGLGVSRTVIGSRVNRRIQFAGDGGYDGPFKVTGNRSATLTVGQGYVHAGQVIDYLQGTSGTSSQQNAAEYDWPALDENGDPTDTTTLSVAALANGEYLLYMTITVAPEKGYFTASYKPAIASCARSAFNARHAGQVILASFTVTDGKVSALRQDQYGNIRVTVACDQEYDAGSDDFYFTNYRVCTTFAYRFTTANVVNVSEQTVDAVNGVWVTGGTDYAVPYDEKWVEGTIPGADTEINGGA